MERPLVDLLFQIMTGRQKLIEPPKRPALRYHGGKWRIAPWIIEHFPKHKLYVEPFGGAAGVLMRKPKSDGEIYNDLDGHIVNLFRVLRCKPQRDVLLELIHYTPHSREEYESANETTDDPVEKARRTLVRAEMGFGSAGATKGTTGFRNSPLRHMGRDRPSRSITAIWSKLPEHLERVSTRLKDVVIENKPAFELISQWDREGTLFYIDPPYLHELRDMRNSGSYRHEMSKNQHRMLLDRLQHLRARAVVSGYDSGMYSEALSNWERVEKGVSIAGHKGSSQRVECLWISPPAQIDSCTHIKNRLPDDVDQLKLF